MPIHNRRDPVSPASELVWLLAGTEARRARSRDRIRELAIRVPTDELTAVMDRHRLRLILGERLQRLGVSTESFDRGLEELGVLAEVRGLLLESMTREISSALEDCGIPMLPLKDVFFAQQVYGRAGVRLSQDIDVLVPRKDMEAAITTLTALGYHPDPEEPWSAFHTVLRTNEDWKPRIEVHWRLHWYGDLFAARMLADSHRDTDGVRRTSSEAVMVALLLYYGKDGFAGLRLASDIASYWDWASPSLELSTILSYADTDPDLRLLIRSAAVVAAATVGVDWNIDRVSLERAGRTAASLANWQLSGDADQIMATVRLVDALTDPGDGILTFIQTRFRPFPSLGANVLYAAKTFTRWVPALASITGGRCAHPLPSREVRVLA